MKVVGKNIKAPAHKGDCGYDLFCDDKVIIEPRSSVVVDTGVRVAIPEGYFGKAASRSGLSVTAKIEVGAGIIDQGYRDEIKIHLYNHSSRNVVIPNYKAIAQLIIIPYIAPGLEFVDVLDETERGEAGFGSTDQVDSES